MTVTNIIMKKLELLWKLTKCDRVMKREKAAGKMVPIDLPDAHKPSICEKHSICEVK